MIFRPDLIVTLLSESHFLRNLKESTRRDKMGDLNLIQAKEAG